MCRAGNDDVHEDALVAAVTGKDGAKLDVILDAVAVTDEGARRELLAALPALKGEDMIRAAVRAVRRGQGVRSILELWQRPTCASCGRDDAAVKRDFAERSRNAGRTSVAIGRLVGVCGRCHKGFCIDHAPYDRALDHIVCPEHRVKLALDY